MTTGAAIDRVAFESRRLNMLGFFDVVVFVVFNECSKNNGCNKLPQHPSDDPEKFYACQAPSENTQPADRCFS